MVAGEVGQGSGGPLSVDFSAVRLVGGFCAGGLDGGF